VLTRLSRVEALGGDLESATPLVEQALQLTEEFALEEELLHALCTKSMLLLFAGRWVEARLLVEGAMARARAAELHERWLNSANNLGVLLEYSDRFAETLTLSDEMLAVARQRGDSQAMAAARLGDIPSLVELGHWDDALARAAEAEQLQASPAALSEAIFGVPVLCERGDLEAAAALLAPHEWQREAEHTEFLASFAVTEARLLRSRNSLAEALAAAERGLACRGELGIASRKVKLSLVEALEAALALDDLVKADELITILDELQPGQLTPILAGERARFHARIAARRGATESVEHDFQTAARTFGEHSLVFRHALTLLEHAEWLVEQERPADARPLLDQAREAFEQLRATPWVERVDAIELGSQAEVPA
jgi:tetratricopeptide (TPR) repeat protein